MIYELEFRSDLNVGPIKVWRWITSFEGINAELSPYVSMSAPEGVRNINDVDIILGKPLFRSWLKLFGFIPIDYLDVTLVAFDEGSCLIEQSRMASMKLWRHERRIIPNVSGTTLVDKLTFEPKLPGFIVKTVVKILFDNRHKKLDSNLNG